MVFFLMKQIRYTQIRVVHEKDPKAFQDEFNQAQIELKSMKPEIVKMEVTEDGIVGIIQYEVDHQEPENAQDEMDIQGLHFTCSDCPRFEPCRNNDGSIKKTSKKGSCILSDWTRSDSMACEWFCREYLKGNIKGSDKK